MLEKLDDYANENLPFGEILDRESTGFSCTKKYDRESYCSGKCLRGVFGKTWIKVTLNDELEKLLNQQSLSLYYPFPSINHT